MYGGSRGQHHGCEAALGGGRRRGEATSGGVGGRDGGCGCSGRSEGARPRREQRGGEALMGGRLSRWGGHIGGGGGSRPRPGAEVAGDGDRCSGGIHRGGVRGRPTEGTAGPAVAGWGGHCGGRVGPVVAASGTCGGRPRVGNTRTTGLRVSRGP